MAFNLYFLQHQSAVIITGSLFSWLFCFNNCAFSSHKQNSQRKYNSNVEGKSPTTANNYHHYGDYF